MENLQKSELVIAKILGLLMDWGLSDCTLKFEELELGEDYREFFFPCVKWLRAEGVIRTGEIHRFMDGGGVVMEPTLTARGLALMGNTMKVGEANITVGTAVQKTTKDTGFYTGLGDLGGGFVGGLLKSLGSG